MRTILLALCAIILVTANVSEEQGFFTRLIQKDYGRTLIQTIQLQLGQDNAVQQIVGMLRQMLEDLSHELASSSSNISQREEECKSKVREIDDTTMRTIRQRAEYERALPLRQEELNDKLQQVQVRQEELQRNRERLQNFQQTRDQEHQEYLQHRDEMMAMINGLKEASNIIKSIKTSSSSSFAQTQSTLMTQLKSHHEKLLHRYPGSFGFRQLTSLLLELCSQTHLTGDEETVQTILSIINELVESIYEVMKQELFIDQEKVKYFSQDMQRIQIEQNRMIDINSRDNSIVDLLTSKLEDLKNQIAVQTMILETKALERADFVTLCQEERFAYQLLTDSRNEQIGVIKQLIEIFENNFSESLRAALIDLQ